MGMKEALSYISFMLVGHTKFAPDHYFGLYKAFRHSLVSTSTRISAIPERATCTN